MWNPQCKEPVAKDVSEIESEIVIANEPISKDIPVDISEIMIGIEPYPKIPTMI